MLDGIGTLARTLLVAPDFTAGARLWREPDDAALAALADYDAHLDGLITRPPRLADAGGLDPLPLELHPDARIMWIAFHDAVEKGQRRDGALAGTRAFASKMPEHAGRLAAVLAVYADPEAGEVSAEAMAGGIALAQHYAAELERLKGAATVDPELRLAERLLAWWQARPNPKLYLAQVYQRGLNAIGDAVTARRIVGILEEHGLIRRLPPGTELDGVPRREAWELVQ